MRVAAVIADRVRRDGTIAGGRLRSSVAARDRDVFPAALAYAVECRWLAFDGVYVSAGDVPPPRRIVASWRREFDALRQARQAEGR